MTIENLVCGIIGSIVAANAVMLIEHASTSERTIAIFFFMSIIPLS